MKHKLFTLVLASFLLFHENDMQATIWHVGATQTYTLPGAVQSLVSDGDTIYIDGGVYANDAVTWSKKNLKFIGLGTSVNPTVLEYSGDIPNEKGIWVFQQPGVSDNPYIENITFDGAEVTDDAGGNGAGIRFQSVNLTVNRCKFEYCQDGILEGGNYMGSNVIIENSEFAYNGYNGTDESLVGYEHGIYISAETDSLVVENCYFHDPVGEGHQLKTRALKSYILYNLIDEAAGNGDYQIDIAQGGLVVTIGNVIIQGINSANHAIIALEAVLNPIEELYFVNNTIINKYPGNVRFVDIYVSSGVNVSKFYNNIFASIPNASNTYFAGYIPSIIDTTKNIKVANYSTFGFVNAAADNYNLLSSAVQAIDKGTACGMTNERYSLTPVFMFQNDSTPLLPRSIIGSAIDIGAYEYALNLGINQITNNDFQLTAKIYPNPINQSSVISFQASVKGDVTLKIYDNSGKCVKVFSTCSEKGYITFEREDLKTGMYYYEIISNDEKVIGKGKMMVM